MALSKLEKGEIQFELGDWENKLEMKDVEVYTGSYNEIENGEQLFGFYKANFKLNEYCARDIDAAITSNPQNPETAVNLVAEEYGIERVNAVLAMNVKAREQMTVYEDFQPEFAEWAADYKTMQQPPQSVYWGHDRPPLLATETADLEPFLQIAIDRENSLEKSNKLEFTMENLTEETIDFGNFERETPTADTIETPEFSAPVNTDILLDENGNLYSFNEKIPLEEYLEEVSNRAAIPQPEDVVKIMAVKEIVASMPTPEMMKIVEAQLMTQSLDDLQTVYPHVFENAEPERSVKAEKIVEEILERAPITNEQYPEVFNEVFNKKIVEPVTAGDINAWDMSELDLGEGKYDKIGDIHGYNADYANPHKGDLTVTIGNISVDNVSEKYIEDLQTVLTYNGVRNFEVDNNFIDDGSVTIFTHGDNLVGLSQEDSDKLAAGHAKSVFKNWNESIDIPVVDATERAETQREISDNEIVRTQAELDGIPRDYDGKITIIGGTEERPIEANNRTIYVENDWENDTKTYVSADFCTVYAGDSVFVTAVDCNVEAEPYANIMAYGESEVYSSHKTWVEAFDNSKIEGVESNVIAKGNAIVTMSDGYVEANDNVKVFSYDSEVMLKGNAEVSGEVTKLTDNRNEQELASSFDNNGYDKGEVIAKQEFSPDNDIAPNDFRKITEPTEKAERKLEENNNPQAKTVKKESLLKRLDEKKDVCKERETTTVTKEKETKEREEISH